LKKKVLFLVLSLVLVFGVTSVASAAGLGLGFGGLRGQLSIDNWTPLSQKLNLTEDQSQKLKELNQSTYEATKELRQKLADAMFELKQMELDTNPDKSAVEAKMKEINELRAQLQDLMQKQRDQMNQILTDEQKQLMKNWHGKGKGPRHGFGQDTGNQNGQSSTENSTQS